MDHSTSTLSNRTMGAFPLSIGTSLALESLGAGTQAPYDPERVIPQQVNLAEYGALWVNLLTLYRNIVGAVETHAWHLVSPGDVVETLEFEVELIKHLVGELTFGKTQVVFYSSNYKGLAHLYPHAKLRVDSTPKQKTYTASMQLVINAYFKRQAKSPEVQHFALGLTPSAKVRALILTHYAYDLLSQDAFNELDLLESHTGLRKTKSAFYTKLTGGKDLMRIPFAHWSLQVFGDSQTFFAFPHKARTQVLALADHYKWTNLTTRDRLLMSFNALEDKELSATLKDML